MSEPTAQLAGTTAEIDTVNAFLAALEDLDIDRAMTYVAPEILYQNVSLPAIRGSKMFGRVMRAAAKAGSGFEARVHRIAANGPVVLTERTDVLEAGALRVEFWVCGVFEIRDGRIVLWRDYFDWAAFLAGFARGVLRAAGTVLSRGRTT